MRTQMSPRQRGQKLRDDEKLAFRIHWYRNTLRRELVEVKEKLLMAQRDVEDVEEKMQILQEYAEKNGIVD